MNRPAERTWHPPGKPHTDYDRDLLERRIQAAFMAAHKEDSPYGAKRWFASRMGMSDKAVYAWCRDPSHTSARDAPGYVFNFLDSVEHQLDDQDLDAAQQRLDEWLEDRED